MCRPAKAVVHPESTCRIWDHATKRSQPQKRDCVRIVPLATPELTEKAAARLIATFALAITASVISSAWMTEVLGRQIVQKQSCEKPVRGDDVGSWIALEGGRSCSNEMQELVADAD